ncbi:sorting nexin-20-like [Lineus longissimus]|uniref:sorting nexin-20-like n=1 Tax=Lineus longissimus TaxID=88925 RepID=UPI002B4F5AA2
MSLALVKNVKMASKKIKKYTDGIDIDDTLSTEGAQSELSLADDGDLSVSYGTLSISTSTSLEQTDEESVLRRDSEISVGCGPHSKSLSVCSTTSDIQNHDRNPSRVHFEIADAGTVSEGRSKYVSYTILVIRSHELDKAQAVIERRYSDFEKLNSALKRGFPQLMETIAFPPKILSGNFKRETIARRSRAFEQYLTHVHSLDEIRRSKEFANFFYNVNLQEAYAHVRNARYKEAIPLLHNAVNIQDKLLGENHKEVIATLCGLVACYSALEQNSEAQECAETALKCIGRSEKNRYLIPLLQISIRLCWTQGKDKTDLEARLADLRNRNFSVDLAPTLLELAVRRFYAS